MNKSGSNIFPFDDSYVLLTGNIDGVNSFTEIGGANRVDAESSVAGGTAMQPFVIGRRNTGANCCFNGDISEIVIYNGALNDAERVVVENNLSSKYGVPTANDHYSLDTQGFYENVFGVGQVDASNQLTEAGAGGVGIAALAGSLTDNEFVFLGFDSDTTGVVAIEQTGNVDFDLTFDATGFDEGDSLALMFSETISGEFSAVSIADVTGGQVTFSGNNFLATDGSGFLSIGAAPTSVPEPVSVYAWLLVATIGFGGVMLRNVFRSSRYSR